MEAELDAKGQSRRSLSDAIRALLRSEQAGSAAEMGGTDQTLRNQVRVMCYVRVIRCMENLWYCEGSELVHQSPKGAALILALLAGTCGCIYDIYSCNHAGSA